MRALLPVSYRPKREIEPGRKLRLRQPELPAQRAQAVPWLAAEHPDRTARSDGAPPRSCQSWVGHAGAIRSTVVGVVGSI